jgi:hypothetical protein
VSSGIPSLTDPPAHKASRALTSRQPIIHLCAPLHLSVRRATSLLPQPPTHRARRGVNRGCRGELQLAVIHTSSVGLGASFGRGVGARGRAPWDWTPVARESLAGLATPPLGHLLPWSDTFMRVIEVMISPLCLPGFPGRVALVTSGFV